MEIQTREANIDVMSVSIKTLHVNKKMMTLSVFRQLPTFQIFQRDGNLKSVAIWGKVRYSIKDEGDLWIVISQNEKLFRCNSHDNFYTLKQAEDNLEEAKLKLSNYIFDLDSLNEYKSKKEIYDKCKEEFLKTASKMFPKANQFEYLDPEAIPQFREKTNWLNLNNPEPKRPELKSNTYVRNHGFSDDQVDGFKKSVTNYEEGLIVAKNANASRSKIAQLDQLFIAV